jgi:hypothetical protein
MTFNLQRHSSLSMKSKRIKSLVLILLLSLVGQAWSVPAICTMADMTNVEMTDASMIESSPCHSMSKQSADSMSIQSMNMDCCDSNSTVNNQHDCSCPDSSCSASFTMVVSFTSAVYIVHEQAQHYSTAHFLNRISTSLYRPPIS